MTTPRPVMLVVLDGWGWREERADNAVRQAHTPHFDALWEKGPHGFLHTSGLDVGLPDGQMGNSEVGHLNIGAGRVVMQDLPRISQAVSSGALAANKTLLAFIETMRKSKGTCHLMGLVSPGGVHAHQDHAAALAHILSKAGVPTLVHAFTDGRDTPPRSADEDIKRLIAALPEDVGIASLCGRYYAMDRDKRWERVSKAYETIVEAKGPRFKDALSVVTSSYADDKSDEFILPAVIGDYQGMRDGDGILCFNFRADRAREILSAIVDPHFDGFARPRFVKLSAAVGMTQYSSDLDAFLTTLFGPQNLNNVLGQVVADAHLRQLRMAETEKYPHVTYFLNGGEEAQYKGEDRIMVPSPKVATYDLQPEMSAPELTDKAVDAILSRQYDLIVLNFANPDMVGHTGDLKAAIKAVETVDAGLGRIVDALSQVGGALIATADHGNCEMMRDPDTGGPHTSHTTNLVPVVGFNTGAQTMREGRLADLAPTLLKLMGLKQPPEMTGTPLI
jgi:2,3-bisphosphoglycerate-independent phosphoglycerate mutase